MVVNAANCILTYTSVVIGWQKRLFSVLSLHDNRWQRGKGPISVGETEIS